MQMELNTDLYHVVESLENAMEEHEEGRLKIWDTECIMKGIPREEMEKRNIPRDIDNLVAEIEWDSTPIGKLHFHQSEVDHILELRPAPKGAIHPKQASEPKELGPRLALV